MQVVNKHLKKCDQIKIFLSVWLKANFANRDIIWESDLQDLFENATDIEIPLKCLKSSVYQEIKY